MNHVYALSFYSSAALQITGWQAEADGKRAAALEACLNADPIPVVSSALPEADEQERGRTGVPMAMDTSTAGSEQKQKKKGVSVKKSVGIKKKKGKKQVGVLSGFNQFHKKGKKGQR